jgi:hypothetical protein
MSITFSTCWYNFKAKFDISLYQHWIDNMLSNVNNYNLVVYCDCEEFKVLEKYNNNPRIRFIIKPHHEFYTYKYRSEWILNHEKNDLLKNWVDWKVNMLWSEKIHFVHETMINKYFDSEFYGWCDIGYFRGRENDLSKSDLEFWPNSKTIMELSPEKIHYGCVNSDEEYIKYMMQLVNHKNEFGLPNTQIPADQLFIAGGFFICHKNKVEWWRNTMDEKLSLYFKHGYLVKDDQTILTDCILSDIHNFELYHEVDSTYDRWFVFQRFLL